ncbi:extracellular solute-binding protein [Rugosimonospora africana]|uniref:Sugar ABC transporter substrate-binding protein n=1 Tax=Rugosimonospora africana TaxID=556532 RepID=A0A8J3VQM3_9ACTN|nr:extracellular solute-binding protein [Rugosimonospora africana]GIH15280.1 sugar ABC transporter substrate-binding protein [Rugosimonospora africana]
MKTSFWRGRTATALAALAMVAGTAGCLGKTDSADTDRNADAKSFTLTIAENSISGGKNAVGADWISKWIIPHFIAEEKAKGKTAHVTFQPSGAADEDYKAKVALDLKTGSGADIYGIDGIWLGEFADAGYIKPLSDEVGQKAVDSWDGWAQIPKAVQGNFAYNDKRYGVPEGTDGRVIFFNKKLFAQAGLPDDWQPKGWDDILAAGQALKAKVPGVTPIQLNAGTAMGEATTAQGILPLLAGDGRELYADGKWQGNTQAVRDVLGFYQKIYRGGLGDPVLQQDAKGRDKSFAEFAGGKIGMLFESDYFWRGVVDPTEGIAKMPDRDSTVGYALIPAVRPGAGIRNQDFVSMSGGSGWVVNPATKYPQQTWELLRFMNSQQATIASLNGTARITQRQDVNSQVLTSDPMLSFVAEKVLPITAFRPGFAVYPQVSQALQQATLDVVVGKSPADAAATYQHTIEPLVGGAAKVDSN